MVGVALAGVAMMVLLALTALIATGVDTWLHRRQRRGGRGA